MKKHLLLAGFLPLFTTALSQTTIKHSAIQKLEPSKEVSGGTSVHVGQKPAESDSAALARLDYQIAAIRRKMEYVKSDQDMFERATKDGWFEQMEKHIASAEAKKKLITNK